jgi:8-oxo-dGTP diphosphatase
MSIVAPHHQLIVVVALIELDNKILTVRRHDPEHAQWHHKWGFPGGKIELHETPADALRREVKEETGLTINSERLLGVDTQHWNTPKGIQQTFILLYHCTALSGEVHLNDRENDDYIWEKPDAIVLRSNFLDGNVKMFQQLFLNNPFWTASIY